MILDGKALANHLELKLRERVANLTRKKNGGQIPILATLLVGTDPASAAYVTMKGKACTRIGMESRRIELPTTTTTQELLAEIHKLNTDSRVHGILLQHPVPSHIDERLCFDAIDLAKDVDGVTCLGFGRMAMGEDAFGSATPAGIMTLLEHYKISLSGMNAVVVGRSAILGKPMAMMLLNQNATLTICHSKTRDLAEILRHADLIVGAVGKPKFILGEWIKDGAVVVDAGYHPAEKCGDVELEACRQRCAAYTPVPGGVGPMTISTLLHQCVLAAEKFYRQIPD